MENVVVLSVLQMLQGGFTESGFQPPLTLQPWTIEERQDDLHGKVDRSFQDLPGYKNALLLHEGGVLPIGVFKGPSTINEEIGDGILPSFLQSKLRDFTVNVLGTAEAWYENNVTPLDQELIRLCSCAYNFVSARKRIILGQYNIEQTEFFSKLDGQNYTGALLQSFGLANLGFDRLRGYLPRIEALDTAPVIPKADKARIKASMDKHLGSSDKELSFWMGRTLGLLALTELSHQLDDIYDVLTYQEETGGPNKGFKIKHSQWVYMSLKLQLQAAFYTESMEQRVCVGRMSQAFEYLANPVSAYIAKGMGAKEAPPFPILVKEVKAKINKEYESTRSYPEVFQTTEVERGVVYMEALARDRFMLGRQILENWKHSQGNSFPYEEQLKMLDTYKGFLEQLRWLQTQFLILEYHIALKSKESSDQSLGEYSDKIREAISDINQDHKELKQSFLADIQAALTSLQPNVDQLKSMFTDLLKRVLLKGNFVNQTSSFDAVVKKVSQRNQAYCDIRGNVNHILWGTNITHQVEAEAKKDKALHKSSDQLEMASPQVSSIFEPASVDAFNAYALKAYRKFETPKRYQNFVEDTQFEKLIAIDWRVIFSDQDLGEKAGEWDWRQQKEDLREYCGYVGRIDELSLRLPVEAQDLILQLRATLLESLRTQVRKDYSTYKSNRSTSWFEFTSYKNMAILAAQSAGRKVMRASSGAFPLSSVLPFRDPEFRSELEARLAIEIVPSAMGEQLPKIAE